MFFGSRPDIDIDVLANDMRKELLLKITGHLGEGQGVHFLGRDGANSWSKWTFNGPTHVETVLETLEMQNCRSVTTPGVDTLKKVTDSEQVFTEELLVSYSGCQIWDVTPCMQSKNFLKGQ